MYLKSQEFWQNFKNHAGIKSKLPKQESPMGIGRVDMSDAYTICNIQDRSNSIEQSLK